MRPQSRAVFCAHESDDVARWENPYGVMASHSLGDLIIHGPGGVALFSPHNIYNIIKFRATGCETRKKLYSTAFNRGSWFSHSGSLYYSRTRSKHERLSRGSAPRDGVEIALSRASFRLRTSQWVRCAVVRFRSCGLLRETQGNR